MDRVPKRRKLRDNPYSLNKDEDNDIYIISFIDSFGIIQVVRITQKVFEEFNKFELDDLSELNEYDNHIEHSTVYDSNLENRIMDKPISLEDEIIRKTTFEDLKKAINRLPKIQRRRIMKYYFEEKTEQQIASEEGTTQQSVHIILERAIRNLKKILKNFN